METQVITPVEALEIMGPNQFRGLEAVQGSFGRDVFNPEKVPVISSITKDALEAAKRRGDMLRLRVSRDGRTAAPLTMLNMHRFVERRWKDENKGQLLYSPKDHPDCWYKDEPFANQNRPRFGWALTSRGLLEGSLSQNDLHQTGVIVDYIRKQVFAGGNMPYDFEDALMEFDEQQELIVGLLRNNSWQKAAVCLANLRLNEISRRHPVETTFDSVIDRDTGESSLKTVFERTSALASDGGLVALGRFAPGGARVGGWEPGYAAPRLGVSFSSSL